MLFFRTGCSSWKAVWWKTGWQTWQPWVCSSLRVTCCGTRRCSLRRILPSMGMALLGVPAVALREAGRPAGAAPFSPADHPFKSYYSSLRLCPLLIKLFWCVLLICISGHQLLKTTSCFCNFTCNKSKHYVKIMQPSWPVVPAWHLGSIYLRKYDKV